MPNHELDPEVLEFWRFTKEYSPNLKLDPVDPTLRALLNAYDAASPDEQKRMLDAARGRTPDYAVSAELMELGFAISAIEENNPNLSHEEAVRRARTLREVSEEIPATNGILRLLAVQGRKLFRRRSAE